MDIVTEVNRALHRPLKNGFQYEKLIPKFQNSTHHFDTQKDESTTYDTLLFMQQWTIKYYKQLERVAPLLKGTTLQETVSKIYNWLYWHFQYNIDTNVQKLFSPSSAWYYRKQGIDCKSYSILASCLLLNLEIPHSFRKVKLRGSNNWGHVYVIVQEGNNYYVIDATTHNNREVNFNEKYDLSMSGLTHIGLASPYINEALNCSCQQNFNPTGLNGYSDMFSGDISNITNYFSGPISCWGGSSYNPQDAENDLTSILSVLHGYLDNMNRAIQDNDMQKFSEMVNMFIGVATWTASISGYKIAAQDWNDCTKDNIRAIKESFDFYRYRVVQALQVWLNKYFNGSENGMRYYGGHIFSGVVNNKYYTTSGELKNAPSMFNVINSYFGEWVTYESSFLIFGIPYFNYQKKENEIPAFEVTPYLIQTNGNASSFNPIQFISGLTNIIDSVFGGDENGNSMGTDNSDDTGISTGGEGNNTAPKSKVNTGVVVGTLAAIGGLAFYLKNRKKTTANV